MDTLQNTAVYSATNETSPHFYEKFGLGGCPAFIYNFIDIPR